MDVSYSLALHMLILISEAAEPPTSAQMASSTGVNASQIRRIAALLKQGGLVESRQGAAGFRLGRDTQNITLLDVYRVVYQCDEVRLLPIHRNPNDTCLVGRYIQPVLSDVFRAAESSCADTMDRRTLADLIADMRRIVDTDTAGDTVKTGA